MVQADGSSHYDQSRELVESGKALSRLGRHEEALEAFTLAAELDPTNANAWISKGVALFRLGRHGQPSPGCGRTDTPPPVL